MVDHHSTLRAATVPAPPCGFPLPPPPMRGPNMISDSSTVPGLASARKGNINSGDSTLTTLLCPATRFRLPPTHRHLSFLSVDAPHHDQARIFDIGQEPSNGVRRGSCGWDSRRSPMTLLFRWVLGAPNRWTPLSLFHTDGKHFDTYRYYPRDSRGRARTYSNSK